MALPQEACNPYARWHPCIFICTHVNLCPYSGICPQVFSRLKDTGLRICLSLATLCQSRAFTCQQVCLPTQLCPRTGASAHTLHLPTPFCFKSHLPHRNPRQHVLLHTCPPTNTLLHTVPTDTYSQVTQVSDPPHMCFTCTRNICS